jgi:hypothetical protein
MTNPYRQRADANMPDGQRIPIVDPASQPGTGPDAPVAKPMATPSPNAGDGPQASSELERPDVAGAVAAAFDRFDHHVVRLPHLIAPDTSVPASAQETTDLAPTPFQGL